MNLMNFIMDMNVWNNYSFNVSFHNKIAGSNNNSIRKETFITS